jgi:hypothetical protein
MKRGLIQMKGQDTYFLERTIEFPNMKVRVFRPVLTELEKAKRMKRIYNSAANLLKEVSKNEKKI